MNRNLEKPGVEKAQASTRRKSPNDSNHQAINVEEIERKYKQYPLVRGLLIHERKRNQTFNEDGKKQILYPQSNVSWFRTIFVFEGRALDRFIVPWVLVTLNAIVWTVIAEKVIPESRETEIGSYENYFALVLNSSLAFLLVFRLNRAGERFWQARQAWGNIIAFSRTMTSGLLIHGNHDPSNRDDAIRWIAVFSLMTMHYMRGVPVHDAPPDLLKGVIGYDELSELESIAHPPVHAGDRIRWHLMQLFQVDNNISTGEAHARVQQLATMEQQLNNLILNMGALERIRATPLPMVYVTHLRTFLLVFLLALPYIWGGNLGYSVIPIVFGTAFALLGLDGAAQEVEAPFRKDRTNHLNMDAFCMQVISNITQQATSQADREIWAEKVSPDSSNGGLSR